MPRAESATEREARQKLLEEQAPAIIWTTDRDLRVTSSVGGGLAAIGLTPDDVVGQTLAEYLRVDDPKFPPYEASRKALAGESASYEQMWAERAYRCRIDPLRNAAGSIVGTVGAALDVTEQHRATEALREAHELLEQRIAERTAELEAVNRLLRRLLDMHERDRQLIAFEIHDGLVQDMTGALMFLETARHEGEGLSEHAVDSLATAIKLVRASVSEARRLINGLRPPILADRGLIPGIEALIEQVQATAQLPIEFQHDVQFERIAPSLELAMFRIVQEGLNNVWQHSQASRAVVTLTQRGDRAEIEIRDFGIGFVPAQVSKNRYGLMGIRERARLLGGIADITSKPGEGTLIHVELPLTDALLPVVTLPDVVI